MQSNRRTPVTYSRSELIAVAEIGRHYLESGGYQSAVVIFDGLAAIDPNEHYFMMALGLAHDRMGEKDEAGRCYRRAQQIAPADARADLNLAELCVETGRLHDALQLIARAEKKAIAARDGALAQKAAAMLTLLRGSR